MEPEAEPKTALHPKPELDPETEGTCSGPDIKCLLMFLQLVIALVLL